MSANAKPDPRNWRDMDPLSPLLPVDAVTFLEDVYGADFVTKRGLRTEREKGRLDYKRIAGRIAYRICDLEEWLNQGDGKCQGNRIHHVSGSTEKAPAFGTSITEMDGAGSEARAREAAKMLKDTSGNGSGTADSAPAQVIPMKSP